MPVRSLVRALHSVEAPPGATTVVSTVGRLRQQLARCRSTQETTEQALDETRQALRITQQALAFSRHREQAALALARRDTLTGLDNRLSFEQRCTRTLVEHASNGDGLCLLFIDLDGFKAINDRFGHDVGDALLQVVGARLLHALRVDDVVCRHGGDEFVCLLPNVRTEPQAMAASRHVAESIAEPCSLGPLSGIQVKASIGMAIYPQDGLTLPALLQRADHAMLQAKTLQTGLRLASSGVPMQPMQAIQSVVRQDQGRRLG